MYKTIKRQCSEKETKQPHVRSEMWLVEGDRRWEGVWEAGEGRAGSRREIKNSDLL